ncbi:ShlB/FhaC/HecB family hemolysin secretion/activation protein [Ideonella livida]|uniref:ShlB/FhaC/HecB family hemolysin secretion/activation protein n=1 Tax=Ideonella livida TaxID=2707176 RepID=A0A7C9PIY9_9BURK|nr:ShlB/FhaC/HecB family hemolysin secretion/activation protein [Ideonella livida]NDY93193.1 ShlB/FhaC/HecB family hemolysin secretion/activation protein [Ideonella livida]
MSTRPHVLLPLCLALALGGLSAVAVRAQPASPAAGESAFDIAMFQIEGNTVLPATVLEAAVAPFLGPGRGMAGVEGARQALEALYQQRGYLTVLVDIPEQRVQGGVVRLSVIEGRVGGRHVLGARWHDPARLREAVPAVAPGQVPDFHRLQAELAPLNQGEALRVQPVVKPGLRPGTVEVELQVRDQAPVSASLELNNQHAAGTAALRLSASARHDHLFQRGHSLQLTLQTAPAAPQQSRALVLAYAVPGQAPGSAWTYQLSASDSDVASLGGVQVLGRGLTVGLRHQQLLPRTEGASVLTLGVDLRRLEETVAFGAQADRFPLRYVPWQASLADGLALGAWQWQGSATLGAAWRVLGRREVSCPLSDGSVGTVDQFACKRNGGDGSFATLRTDHRLQRAAPGGQWALRLAGQWASGPLVSAEQASLGGADSVRGYHEGEASGDHSRLLSLEWRGRNRWPAAPAPASEAPAPASRQELVPLFFADVAQVRTESPAPGQAGRQSLWGVGAGVRAAAQAVGLQWEAGLDLARAGRASAATAVGDWRLHARLQARF